MEAHSSAASCAEKGHLQGGGVGRGWPPGRAGPEALDPSPRVLPASQR